ncbi:YjgN family protein [Methylobacterium oryzihabitans]|nr:YjgN family protein [Methylobacterium oryzihabitans]
MTIPNPAGGPQRAAVAFDARLDGLIWLAVKGFLLSIVTFGIYRFWYVTDLRRFFWTRTAVAGSPAEYNGTGKELFLGFLVALAILVPVYLVLFGLSVAVPAFASVSVVVSFVGLFLLGQFAIYRGRRYRATRTLWRGMRLGQDGSAFAYAARAGGWWLVIVLTFGLAFPFMRADLERYRINHTLVGTSRMTSTASGRSVLGPFLLIYLLALGPLVGVGLAMLVAADFSLPTDLMIPKPGGNPGDLIVNPAYDGSTIGLLAKIGIGTLVLCVPAALLLVPYYRARETRAFMAAARLGGVGLESTLRARQFYWPYFVYALSGLGVLLALGIAATLLAAVSQSTGIHGLYALLILVYPVVLLLFGALYVRQVQARLWAAVATTTAVVNPGELDAILASARAPGSGLQEGLADALDVGGSLQIGF